MRAGIREEIFLKGKKMKKNKLIIVMLVSLTCCICSPHGLLLAADDIPIIETKALKHELDSGAPMVLANALSSIEFKDLTIKGSVSIPSSKVAGNPMLPKDKGTPLVFFCKGSVCIKSFRAAKEAVALGYTNVKIYKAGLPDWVRKRFPVTRTVKYPKVDIPKMYPQEVYEKLDEVVILDIRGEESKQIGEIKHGLVMNIPLDDLEEKYNALSTNEMVVIVDLAGKQVDICGRFLVHKGYTKLAGIEGGAQAWIKMIRRMERKELQNNSEVH